MRPSDVRDEASARRGPGGIALTLGCRGGAVCEVAIRGRGLGPLRHAMIGQTAAAAPALIARLCPLAGQAHAIVTRRAIEAAQDLPIDMAAETRREAVIAAEAASAHVWRAAIDWASLAGLPARIDAVRAARFGVARVMAGEVRDGHDRLARVLATQALTGSGGSAGRLSGLLAGVELARDPALGPRTAPWFASRLAADLRFGDRPEAETGPADPANLPAAPDRIAALAGAARALGARLAAGIGPPDPAAIRSGGSGAGCGLAMTALGPLTCWIRLEEGLLADFRAVAPTEWLTHPRGALTRSLLGLSGPDIAGFARRVLAAFDPCADAAIACAEATDA